LFFKSTFLIALGGFFVKGVFQLIIFYGATKKLNEKDLLKYSLIYEFILLFIYPIFFISKLLDKRNKWKS
jgi:hypothetical protein